ncbi:MAG: alcohol dehydrogenase catalytic domain-containing protein, partial [Actinobacteria bacterium]|nr:alcohol dehydrogenase catalytic domain-containing protein [Actinomycetota bacterium]
MRALQIFGPGEARLTDVPEPHAGLGEVRLRVGAASLCHTDVALKRDPASMGLPNLPLPMTIGHEFVGWVDEIGEGVTGIDMGQLAAPLISQGCGHCSACARGQDNVCAKGFSAIGVHRDGGIAEHVVVPATHIIGAEGLDLGVASALTDAGLTAYHSVALAHDVLRPGGWSVVIGCGGLGHVAVQLLARTRGSRVIAVDTEQS